MKIKEVIAKQIISKSGLPGADYVINPYVGCMHSCIYCYACFMKRFTGHEEKWGDFVDVKINAPELVPNNPADYRGKSIFFSSVTDPYMALERKYLLTRKILEKLVPLQPNLGIQTKSDLILRDIDLFKQFKNCEIGMTITSTNDEIRRELEPFAASVEKRFEALKKLKEAGLTTYVFIGPILPHFTDWKRIILDSKEYVDFYMLENLNVKGVIWSHVKEWLQKKHPELIKEYEQIYFLQNDYWDEVEEEIRKFCKVQKVECRIYFHHKKKIK